MKLISNLTKISPIRYDDWKSTKCISGRVAAKRDIENGSAVFYLKNAKQHKTIDIDLPTLAYLCDHKEKNDDYWEVVIIVQYEYWFDNSYSPSDSSGHFELVGYRKFNGEASYCFPYDIKWFRDYEIEKFI